jgi:N-acetylglucosamine-6-phosphate deacetylase
MPLYNAAEPVLLEARRVYDGTCEQPLPDQALLLQDGLIVAMGDAARAQGASARALHADVVAPGFIDLQINGANGVLFNERTDAPSLDVLMLGARRGGTAYALPTFITATGQQYLAAMDACEQALNTVPGVLGVHLEGPFLNPARAGIHARTAIRPLAAPDVQALCQRSMGQRVLTLAPECADPATLGKLRAAGWILLAGHTEAGWACMQSAKAAGLAGCTHLFNAMPPIQGREPGVVGAVLCDDALFATVIADGIHVHAANLQLAAQTLGDRRLCLVTDAMPTLGTNLAEFVLDGHTIYRTGNSLSDAQGTLAGAHLPMDQAVRNMVQLARCSVASALRMASTAPAHALGLSQSLGHIAIGYRAGLTLLDDALQAHAVVVDGHVFGTPR